MPLKLMFITNDKDISLEAQKCGIDRIFIDLEHIGKKERQGHLDTVISAHSLNDINQIREVITESDVLVRSNPMNSGTKKEIDEIIARGADIIMLPMIKTPVEVEQFVSLVNGRARTCLLIETPQSMVRFDDILNVGGIDEVHIGLNDMHIGLGVNFMFELLSGGILEYLCGKMADKNITYGFGGIARIGQGILPAELILGEHYRLGSQMVILSRAFHGRATSIVDLRSKILLDNEIRAIRQKEIDISSWIDEQYEENQRLVKEKVDSIVSTMTA